MKNRAEIPKKQLSASVQVAGVNFAVGFQCDVIFRTRDGNRGVNAILEKYNVFGVCHFSCCQSRIVVATIENHSERGRCVAEKCR